MRHAHKKYWLTGLVGLLAAWLFLEYRLMQTEEDRFARRMLRIARVEEVFAGTASSPQPATPYVLSSITDALSPHLLHLSACLATDDASHAPLTLILPPSAQDATSPQAWSIPSQTVPEAQIQCALDVLQNCHPNPPTHATIHISLAPLALENP